MAKHLASKFYTAKEVAEILHLDPSTVRDFCRSGIIRAYNLSESEKIDDHRVNWRISETSLEDFLAKRCVIKG